jgi:hypothetical protein
VFDMSRIRGIAAVAALVVVLGTSGCVAGQPAAEGMSSAAAAPSATPTPTATATPAPTTTPQPEPATALTCDELVDPVVIDEMVSNGVVADPLWPNESDLYGTLHQRFAEFGGVSCRWGAPDSDNVAIYSYSPTTPQQSALLESELIAAGYRTEPRDRGTVYISPEIPGTFFLVTGISGEM